MDKSRVMTLYKKTYTKDSIGQHIETLTARDVYVNIRSVSRSEWFAGGEKGLNPEYVASMFAPDYEGEELAKLDDVKYQIYRTYEARNDVIELYLTKQVGATNG